VNYYDDGGGAGMAEAAFALIALVLFALIVIDWYLGLPPFGP
jgi:hypothetical protein